MIFDELLIQRTLGHMKSYYFGDFQPKVDYLNNQGELHFFQDSGQHTSEGGEWGHGKLNLVWFSPEFYYKLS